MTEHSRDPDAEEMDVLVSIHKTPEKVALMPVFFNGQERFALVLLCTNSSGNYIRVLAILTNNNDALLNGKGDPAAVSPPMNRGQLN